ncbi:MAG: TQO small subunit DoxD [Actinomycetota bacterium]
MHAQNHHRPGRSSSFLAGVVASWRGQPLAVAVLRAFLGVTFVYAGIQKFADPTFFDSSSSQWIGAQLHGFAQSSPLRPVLLVLAHVPTLSGLAIALLEIGVGLATLLGVVRIAAAAGGFAISVLLWLSATWNVHPYFLGSDSIYAVAWLALLVGILEGRRDRDVTATAPPLTRSGLARRDLLRGGAVAAASILIGAVAHAFAGNAPTAQAGARSNGLTDRARRNPPSRPAASRSSSAASPSPSPTRTAPAIKGRTIGSIDRMNVGDAVAFNDPGVGPAVLLRTGRSDVAAFSRICTHAGCEVGYDASRELLVCPCHGAEFDPTRGARPVAGPAPTPLPSIKVEVDPSSGDVILPS